VRRGRRHEETVATTEGGADERVRDSQLLQGSSSPRFLLADPEKRPVVDSGGNHQVLSAKESVQGTEDGQISPTLIARLRVNSV
jgi:hypothetical protein